MRGWLRGLVAVAILVAIWAAGSEIARTPLFPGPIAVGAAIVDGVVYWGSGYDTKARALPYDGNNNKFYAFSIGGK